MRLKGGVQEVAAMFKSLKLPLRRSFSQEVQQVPQGSIVVQLYGDVDTPGASTLLVEHHPGKGKK